MPAGSGELGVSVNVVAGDAVCVNVRGEPAGHSRLKALADAVTLSLKLMTMVELTGTLVAPAAGVVLLTLGAVSPPPHGASGDAVFRGVGVPIGEICAVAVGFGAAGAGSDGGRRRVNRVAVGAVPSKQFVPVPIADEIDDARRRAGAAS